MRTIRSSHHRTSWPYSLSGSIGLPLTVGRGPSSDAPPFGPCTTCAIARARPARVQCRTSFGVGPKPARQKRRRTWASVHVRVLRATRSGCHRQALRGTLSPDPALLSIRVAQEGWASRARRRTASRTAREPPAPTWHHQAMTTFHHTWIVEVELEVTNPQEGCAQRIFDALVAYGCDETEPYPTQVAREDGRWLEVSLPVWAPSQFAAIAAGAATLADAAAAWAPTSGSCGSRRPRAAAATRPTASASATWRRPRRVIELGSGGEGLLEAVRVDGLRHADREVGLAAPHRRPRPQSRAPAQPVGRAQGRRACRASPSARASSASATSAKVTA